MGLVLDVIWADVPLVSDNVAVSCSSLLHCTRDDSVYDLGGGSGTDFITRSLNSYLRIYLNYLDH